MILRSQDGCQLSIGEYPTFKYNALGGGGKAIIKEEVNSNKKKIYFDPSKFEIPSLDFKTTKILGLAIPPGLEIKILTRKLEGDIDLKNGILCLKFEARFSFTICSIFKAPDLLVKTFLTNKEQAHNSKDYGAKPFLNDREIQLKGSANVPVTGNLLLDSLLSLPNEAKAILVCKLYGIYD